MKHLSIIFALLLAITPITSFSSNQTPKEVPLIEEVPPTNRPRGAIQCPISAYVFVDSIMLSFSENLGIIEVTLDEEVEGLIFDTTVNTSNYSAIIPFGGSAGDYTLTINLSSGAEYIGSFVI